MNAECFNGLMLVSLGKIHVQKLKSGFELRVKSTRETGKIYSTEV